MANYVSVAKPTAANAGLPNKPQQDITFISVGDIDTFPAVGADGITYTGNIVLKAGAKAFTIYGTLGTFEVTSPSEGDPDNKGFIPQLVFNHPGNEIEIRQFKARALNDNFIIILDYCKGNGIRDILGTPCNPMQPQLSYTNNNDSNVNQMTFAQAGKGNDIGIFSGDITETSVTP